MPGTSFDDVLLVNPSRIRPATSDGISLAQAELGVRMPPGYAAYVERLGKSALGHFFRVYTPARLPDLTRAWRERVIEYWFWDTSETAVEPESLQERGVVSQTRSTAMSCASTRRSRDPVRLAAQ